jgi:hypothetical protein
MKNHPCRRFFFFLPLIALAFVALFSAIVMLLWNNVLADVVPVHAVTFWQAAGILLLAKILFGGFPGRPGRRRWGPWRQRWLEKHWDRIPPEHRERLREEMRRRFGDWPRPPWGEPEDDTGTPAPKIPPSPPG